jgi:hypothetical protein
MNKKNIIIISIYIASLFLALMLLANIDDSKRSDVTKFIFLMTVIFFFSLLSFVFGHLLFQENKFKYIFGTTATILPFIVVFIYGFQPDDFVGFFVVLMLSIISIQTLLPVILLNSGILWLITHIKKKDTDNID